MSEILHQLLEDGVIDEIIGRLKSGKEADVYLVQHRGEVVAAKVYKNRETRNFKSNAVYKEGRQVRNSRTRRAIEKGSRFGQHEAEEAWKSAEVDALYRLHAAGVRVPVPKMFYEGVLLMELVIDAEGEPAPRLIDAHIDVTTVPAIYRELRRAMVGALCCDLIHGDLSPYNVLLGTNGPVLIDFPQMMSAAHNNRADHFFRRDFENIHRFLAHLDPSLLRAETDGYEIWRAYLRRELTPDFVPTGRVFQPRPQPPPRPQIPQTQQKPSGRGQPPQGRPQHPQQEQRPQHPREAQQRPDPHLQGRPQAQNASQTPRANPNSGPRDRSQYAPPKGQESQRPRPLAPQQRAPAPQQRPPQHRETNQAAPNRPMNQPMQHRPPNQPSSTGGAPPADANAATPRKGPRRRRRGRRPS